MLALGALGIAGVYATEFVQARRLPAPAPQTVTPATPEGTLTVDSRPEGAQVNVDSIPRGVTPLKLTLPVGDHTLELQNGSATRSIPLAIQAGVVVSQYVDLAPAATPAAVGRMEITSDPAGARVTVDGVARGVTPVSLSNVVPGNHAVSIFGADSTVTRAVTVSAGSTASVMVSLTPAGASAGWVAFKVPFEMQLSEGGKLVGTTGTDRLMLPAGRHDLVLSNPALEFEATLSVQVAAGKTVTPTVTIPTGLAVHQRDAVGRRAARRPGRWDDAARESLGARRHPRDHLPSSSAWRAAPDGDRQGADADARRHLVQMIAALFAFGIGLVASQTSPADAAASDLAAAKALYASASYEEALSRLSTVRRPEELDQIEEYRALCLLALGRATDAEHALERLVARKPLYMSSEDVSPRLLGMLHGVRKRLLPAAARGVYAKAKVDFEEKNYTSAVDGFTELLAIVSDPDAADARPSLSDLKQLGEGFLKLATTEAAAATRGGHAASLAEAAGHLLIGRPRSHAAGRNPAGHARVDPESADPGADRIPRDARGGRRREGQRGVRGDSEADDSRLRRGAA